MAGRARVFRFGLFFTCLIIGLSVPLLAQFTTASLNGVVSDSTGASIPSAKVTAVNRETGLTKTVSTGEDGAFLFPLLPVGTYRLNVEKGGFSRYVQEGIALSVNQSATQNVVLQVGKMESEVRVVADAGMLNTQTATLSQLIDNQRVADLPLNGRTAQSLVFLAPGTVLGPATGEGGTYPNAEQVAVVNGGERLSVNYLMDGAGHNDTYVGVNLPFPNPDAIQEFNLQTTNMSAEFGNGTSVVSIVTKSGTNQLHGDAFEFLRNGDLNARNFFAPTHDTLNRNQYGGTAGGPIRKDRLFFFGTYQGTRNDTAAAGGVSFVPTAAERNGDLSAIAKQLTDPSTRVPFPNNQIPLSQITGPAQYFMKDLPLPNGPNGQLTYLGPHDNSDDEQFMTKVDYNRGKNQISGRYFFTRYSLPPDESTVLQDLLAMDPNGTRVRVQTLALNHTYSATPTLLFNTWFGWDSQVGGSLSGDPASAPITYPAAGVQIAGGANGVPPAIEGLAVSGFFSIASGHFGTFNRGDWRIRETVTHERSGHELVFGGEAVRVRLDINNQNTQSGSFTFGGQLSGSNLSDFLLGDSSSFTQGAGQFTNVRGTIYDLFVQDNWRVSKKLTVNLGLRWDPFWPYTETKNRVPCFIIGEQSKVFPNAPTGLVYGGDPGCPAGTGSNSSLANFAPRLGFAYQLGSRTMIRGGAGIYYAALPENVFDGTGATAPFTPRFTLTGVSFVNPYGSAGVPNPFPAQFTGGIVSNPNVAFTLPVQASNSYGTQFSAPTMSTWNLHLERQFAGNWLASAGYIGNAGWHLSSSQNTNANGNVQANPAVYIPGQSTVANTQARRLVPTLSSVTQYQTDYNTRYDGLQLTMERRLSRGLSLLGNYTWSKRIDNYPGTKGVGTDPFDRNFDWGVSPDDRTHIFNLSAVWQIPIRFAGPAGRILNGWEATSITSWQSGAPFSILSGVDNSFSGNGRDRADFIGTSIGQAVRSGLSHAAEIQKFFNTSLFVPNAIGTFGNSGKDILRGPRSFDTDMALIKNTKLVERLTLQLRGEFFNVFNNVNFGAPGATVGTPAFGEITSAGNPRILQFSAKLLF